jgi:hypothetical protein
VFVKTAGKPKSIFRAGYIRINLRLIQLKMNSKYSNSALRPQPKAFAAARSQIEEKKLRPVAFF